MRTLPDENDQAELTGPTRRCILSGEHGAREEMIRLVAGPDGSVWPDLGARLPGRGAWIMADRARLEEALARGRLRGALGRAFGASPPAVPGDLADRIAQGLEQRALGRLGLELRAGHLIFGFEKLAEWARAGRCHMLLHAGDAAADGVARLDQALRVGSDDAQRTFRQRTFRLPVPRSRLSAALGRENVVHCGVVDGKAAARIAADLSRWIGFGLEHRMMEGDAAGPAAPHEEGRE